jgi:hypothetical protein
MENKSITKAQLISSIIFNGGNSIIFLFFLKALFYNQRILFYLTYLSYCANSIYLLFCLICDIFIYLKEKNSEENVMNYYKLLEADDDKDNNKTWIEKLNNWNRNNYGIICNTFSFFVTICFWTLYFMGESYIKISSGFYSMLRTFYLHLIITIIIIIDIYNRKRNCIYSCRDINIIFTLFLIYTIFIAIIKFYFNINPYAFMHSSWGLLMIFIFIFFLILYFCYRLNLWLINYINDKYNNRNNLMVIS